VDKLRSRSGTHSISLKNCERDILRSFNASSVVDDVVDDLFPMAQGIHDSAIVSSCLRFSIEYLRLRVMSMISSNKLRDLTLQIDAQHPVVAVWRNRLVVFISCFL
jgi:hypothetical protein